MGNHLLVVERRSTIADPLNTASRERVILYVQEAFLRTPSDRSIGERYCVLELGYEGELVRLDRPVVRARPSIRIRPDLRGGRAEFEYLEGDSKGQKVAFSLDVSGYVRPIPREISAEDLRKWRIRLLGPSVDRRG